MFELFHMSEDCAAHGKCRYCSEYISKQLIMNSLLKDFGNLKDNHIDEQFRLLLRKGVYSHKYMSSWVNEATS